MSQTGVDLNPLHILNWEPAYGFLKLDEDPSPEELLTWLCSRDVGSVMSDIKKRYVEASKVDQDLRVTIAEPHLTQNLFGPLRLAKANYILGNYAASISLCGVVAEKLAIFVHHINTSCADCHVAFQNMGQSQRVDHLKKRGLITNQSKQDLGNIRTARNRTLHYWDNPNDDSASKAAQVYAAATRLLVTMMGITIVAGKLELKPELWKYLKEKGAISDEAMNRNSTNKIS